MRNNVKPPAPPAKPIGEPLPEQHISNDGFADNAEVRRVLIDALYRLGQGRLAPSLQKRILAVLHPEMKRPKSRFKRKEV
jgi:hypothetical protein